MKKITIAVLVLISIISFSSFKVSADEPEQYVDYWEPAVDEYIGGTYYSFDLTHNTTTNFIGNTSSYAQSGVFSEVGYTAAGTDQTYCTEKASGSTYSSITYVSSATTTWQRSAPTPYTSPTCSPK